MRSADQDDCKDAQTGISGRLGKADRERGELSNLVISSGCIGWFLQDSAVAFSSVSLLFLS